MTIAALASGQAEDSAPLEGALAGKMTLVDVKLTDKKEEVPVTVLRRGAGLYGLLQNGTISAAQVKAAEKWARDYETGVEGATDPERYRSGRRGDIHDMMIARAQAVARYEGVRRSLGRRASDMLTLLVIEGLSVSRIAMHYQRDRKQIVGAIDLLLEQLVEYFDCNAVRIKIV
ncbi:hypothetical protein [Gluconobacter morbifer]|uniref:Uncharacterized protein n=1 Tax=Gluconobacter morbifer G707 TaxID=1088869 RepID=G6XIW7_9PROT|nr:hypothetical protein [Gluconobacter morbifer]EHH68397.1 hypothetical protein GMO_11670 [Gluconobacter morbifer G707]